MATSLVHDTQVTPKGLQRLLAQYKGKPRMTVLISSYLDEFQEVEDAAYSVYFARAIQNAAATGDLLAKLGKIVGQGSEGLSDSQFLTLITARIQANRSSGRREQLIKIANLLSSASSIYVKDYPPAAVLIQMDSLALPPELVGRDFLGVAVAGGVLLMFLWSLVSLSNTFVGGSIYTPGFTAGPPPTNTGATAAQSPGSIYDAVSPPTGFLYDTLHARVPGVFSITGGAA